MQNSKQAYLFSYSNCRGEQETEKNLIDRQLVTDLLNFAIENSSNKTTEKQYFENIVEKVEFKYDKVLFVILPGFDGIYFESEELPNMLKERLASFEKGKGIGVEGDEGYWIVADSKQEIAMCRMKMEDGGW